MTIRPATAASSTTIAWSFPRYIDPSKKIPSTYGTSQLLPEAYLISRDGRIARKIVGQQDWDSPELLSAVDTPAQRKIASAPRRALLPA